MKDVYKPFFYKVSIAIIFFAMFACTPNSDKPLPKNSEQAYQEMKVTRIKFNFNQTFVIKEIKKGRSISDLRVSGVGFQNSAGTISFNNCDPLDDFWIADLDNNGFEELYVTTKSVGSGSYIRIYGVVSIGGKSYKSIYVPEFDTSIHINRDYLAGYMGHDSVYIKNNRLCREFPVYNKSDINSAPSGGKRLVVYKLVGYGGSYSLQFDFER